MSATAPVSPVSAPAGGAAAAWRDVTVELPQLAPVPTRIYGQRKRGQVQPLVVHFHGGAFVAGGLDNGRNFASLLADSGAIVVSIAYPLAPAHPFPQAIDVGYGVLEWAWKQRTKLAGTGAPVFLAGEEAGGNLAAAVTVIARDRHHPPIAGQVLISPMLDPCVGTQSVREAVGASTQCKWAEGWRNYLRCPQDSTHPYAVPGGSLRLTGLAPTLVLTSSDDPMRDEARTYAGKLQAAGVPVTFEELTPATGWPDSLVSTQPMECACAAMVRPSLLAFFAAAMTAGTRPPAA
ncbi:alpha/beta hydrolase [Pseudorhodoferax sp. Leaf267]|uniref:alpha/beta hydrolase n=1 Tax=Pseudorhodoferax sp. Leaf267 TaxID=1736316 RepID=UPI0006F43F0F|nr:alpha/beta hydrolase [Pseudorhodoferax sp. Leaf267]KQP14060.1 alpha/beta hydrolase [Pseudorhodoferax sp. Leaf267]